MVQSAQFYSYLINVALRHRWGRFLPSCGSFLLAMGDHMAVELRRGKPLNWSYDIVTRLDGYGPECLSLLGECRQVQYERCNFTDSGIVRIRRECP